MEVKDFRVDNWINVLNPKTNEWHFEKLKAKTILNFSENSTHHLIINNFKPITLTEDILLKCGFEINNKFLILKEAINDSYSFFCDIKESLIQIETDYCCAIDLKHIKYLHQLQNLYFVLTNKELEINL